MLPSYVLNVNNRGLCNICSIYNKDGLKFSCAQVFLRLSRSLRRHLQISKAFYINPMYKGFYHITTIVSNVI